MWKPLERELKEGNINTNDNRIPNISQVNKNKMEW